MRIRVGGLQVATEFAQFVNAELLPKTDLQSDRFWSGFEALINELPPRVPGDTLIFPRFFAHSSEATFSYSIGERYPMKECSRYNGITWRSNINPRQGSEPFE